MLDVSHDINYHNHSYDHQYLVHTQKKLILPQFSPLKTAIVWLKTAILPTKTGYKTMGSSQGTGPPASAARYSWDARSSHCIAPVYQLGTPWGHAFGGNVKYVVYYIHIMCLYIHIIYILYTYYIHIIYILYTYYIHIIYILYTYYIHIIYILYTYYIHIIHSGHCIRRCLCVYVRMYLI